MGDLLYHGTSVAADFTELNGPAWLSDSWKVASRFVGWHAGPRPRVMTYRVIDVPRMAMIDSERDFAELAEWVEETTGLDTGGEMHEIADAVCSTRLDGWHSPDNYPEGSDTLICRPGAFLEFVGEEMVKKPTKNPPKATAAARKVERLVGPAPLCYPAAEVVYHAGGGRRAGLTPVQQKHEGVSHWWVRGPKGEVLDPAAAQFSRPVPYERGRGRGFLTARPSLRAKALAGLAGVRMNPGRDFHYLNVITSGPLVIVRVPWPMPRWRSVLKAMMPVLREHGVRQMEVQIEGLTPDPDQPWTSEEHAMAILLDAAFDGARERFARFWLYDWRDGKFEFVRRPTAS